jgi:hypothetical protein
MVKISRSRAVARPNKGVKVAKSAGKVKRVSAAVGFKRRQEYYENGAGSVGFFLQPTRVRRYVKTFRTSEDSFLGDANNGKNQVSPDVVTTITGGLDARQRMILSISQKIENVRRNGKEGNVKLKGRVVKAALEIYDMIIKSTQ